jgi:hypothetical protein
MTFNCSHHLSKKNWFAGTGGESIYGGKFAGNFSVVDYFYACLMS